MSYATLADAKTAIDEYLATNTEFSGEINVGLNDDVTFSDNEFALENDSAYLRLHLNGYTATATADANVRANIDNGDAEAQGRFVINDGVTLTLLPTSHVSDERTETFIDSVGIQSADGGAGNLILGESVQNDAAVDRALYLDNVPITDIANLTLQGETSYNYSDDDDSTTELVITDTFRLENQNDDNAYIYQHGFIGASAQCKNLIWNGSGTVTDMTVTDTLTVNNDYRYMEVRNDLSVNNITIMDAYCELCINEAVMYNGDNKNALISEATVTINGTVTAPEERDISRPIVFQKKKIIQRTKKDENGNPYTDEEHYDGAFEEGEVVATVNSSADVSFFRLEQNEKMFPQQTEEGNLIARKTVVEVGLWAQEAEYDSITADYASLEDAVAGIPNDFGGATGQYNFNFYGDVKLTQDIAIPAQVENLCVNTHDRWVDTDDASYDEVAFTTLDFNGHSMTISGDVNWSEAVRITNSASGAGTIIVNADAENMKEFRFDTVEEGAVCVDTSGKTVKRTAGTPIVWAKGVQFNMPNGRLSLNSQVTGLSYQIDGDVVAAVVEAHNSNWKIKNLQLTAENDNSFVGEAASLAVTGTTKTVAGIGFEVRGALTLTNLEIAEKDGDPDACFVFELVTTYDRDNANQQLAQGSLAINGTVTSLITGRSSISFNKKNVYQYQATDEGGNSYVEEEQEWNQPFATGETLATIAKADTVVKTSLFEAWSEGDISYTLKRSGNALKVYHAAVVVDYWDEKTETGVSHSYVTLEEAFSNMAKDFSSVKGNYTVTLLDDVKMSANITVPSFVTNLRLQSKWEWIEDCDNEGNPIEGQGHNKVHPATLDMNGKTITSPGTIQIVEGLKLVSTAVNTKKVPVAGKITSNAKSTAERSLVLSFEQVTDDDIEFVDENGNGIDRNESYEYTFTDQVDIAAPNGEVGLWADWGTYHVNSINAKALNVRANWNVASATLANLYVDEGWYDEENDRGGQEGNVTFGSLSLNKGASDILGECTVTGTLNMSAATLAVQSSGRLYAGTIKVTSAYADEAIGAFSLANYGYLEADELNMSAGTFDNQGDASIKNVRNIKDFYNRTVWYEEQVEEDNPDTADVDESRYESRMGGARLVCDTFNQSSSGKSYLQEYSELIVNEKAVIYNPYIGAGHEYTEEGCTANIYRMPDATIAIQGKVTSNYSWINLNFGVFAPDSVEGVGEQAVRIDLVEVLDDEENSTGRWFAFVNEDGSSVYTIDGDYPVKNFDKGEVLFTTAIKEFPTEIIGTHQNEDASYWKAYQMNGAVRAGSEWIIIKTVTRGDDEDDYYDEKELKSFMRWSDAEAYIATLSNPNISYIIEITEDLDIEGNLKLPAKAKEVVIRGGSEDQITLTYTGDLTLTTNTVFENVKLNAVKNGAEYASVVSLKGYYLVLSDSEAHFASVTGTKTSYLTLVDSHVTVDKAVKTLKYIDLQENEQHEGSTLTIGEKLTAKDAAISGVESLYAKNSMLTAAHGSIAFTADTWIADTTIEAETKINFKDIYSLDDKNQIIYGGNGTANILTITGNVYGPDVNDVAEEYQPYIGEVGVDVSNQLVTPAEGDEGSGEAPADHVAVIRRSAIDISVKAFENSEDNPYAQDVLLVNAAKAPAAWFVVGSTYDASTGARTGAGSLTHKSGTQILYGAPTDGDVVLQVQDFSISEDALAVQGSYATIEEAFAEIERIGDKEGMYYILLKKDAELASSTVKTPKNAQFVKIYAGDSANPRTIAYNKELQLNSSLFLMNIVLDPKSDGKITLSGYTLMLDNTALADGKKIGSIAGSGTTKTSVLTVKDSQIPVSGDVSGVGTLYIVCDTDDTQLVVDGKTTVGDIAGLSVTEEDQETPKYIPTLVGTAAVTRDKAGAVTKIAPQIKIEGEMDYSVGGIYIALREKVVGADKSVSYDYLDFSANEMANVLASGIQLAEAKKVSSMFVSLSEENNGQEAYTVTKAGGYLVYQSVDNVGIELRYEKCYVQDEEETFVDLITYCKSFADAVTEINNLKTKQWYEIRLTEKAPTLSQEAPTTLTMPAKNMAEGLVICTVDDESDALNLCYTGNITFTCDVDIYNVNFVQVAQKSKSDKAYVSVNELKNGYPSAVSVSTGGFNLNIAEVSFNTPINLDGSKKGTLTLSGVLRTDTNEDLFDNISSDNGYVCGSIKNFAEVNLDGQELRLVESKNGSKYTAPGISATILNVDGSALSLGYQQTAKVDVTTLNATDDSEITVYGSLTAKNANLGGTSDIYVKTLALTNVMLQDSPVIQSNETFTISGNLISMTSDAVLCGRRNGKGVPYLNITGTVTLTNPANKIQVGIIQGESDQEMPDLEGSPSATGMLLNAKTATADMFVPYVRTGEGEEGASEDNVKGKEAYSEEHTDGYFLMKSGTGIYVYYGEDLGVALYKGDASGEAAGDAELLGYYTGLKEAVTALDARKDKTATYTLLLMKEVNSATAPAAVTLPAQAQKVIIAGKDATKNIYFTGNLTLKADTVFANVTFQPMTTRKAPTNFDITTGAFDLTLEDVSVADGMGLKNITGNAKQDTLLASKGLEIKGNVTGSRELIVSENATVKGNVKAARVTLNGKELTVDGTFTADNLTLNGATLSAQKNTVTIRDIENAGTAANTINYGKSTRAPYLNIKGIVNGANTNPVVLNLVTADAMTAADYAIADAGTKCTLSDSKKLAVIEKAPLSDFTMKLNGADYVTQSDETDGSTTVIGTAKANKGVYVIAQNSLAHKNQAVLQTMENGSATSSTNCLDFAQAVNEINNRADKTADYVISVETDVTDTNLTDANATSAITMPKANMANSVTIQAQSGKLDFTGNISYAGKLGFKDVEMKVADLKNVTTLTLDNATLLTTGTVTVKDVVVKGASKWDAFGKTTITNLDATAWATSSDAEESGQTEGAYIASRQTARTLVPMFTINGEVTGTSVWKVITDGSKATELQYVTTYKNVSLAVAPKASADAFRAYPFADTTPASEKNDEGITEIIAYKDTKKAVINGDMAEMKVKITKGSDEVTYAKSFDEAVAVIENAGDTSADYEVEILAEGQILTTKNGTAYGALTLPKKAHSVKIVGQMEDGTPKTVLAYTGTMKTNGITEFDNILLTEGTIDNKTKAYVPSYAVTLALGSNDTTLTFGENAATWKPEANPPAEDLVITSMNGSKAKVVFQSRSVRVKGAVASRSLELNGDTDMSVAGDIKVDDTLSISDLSELTSDAGKVTVKTVSLVDADTESANAAILAGIKAITITDIKAVTTDANAEGDAEEAAQDSLQIQTSYSTDKTAPVSQLEIKGTITDADVDIATQMYVNGTGYHPITAADVTALAITDAGAKLEKKQKLATIPMASVDTVDILVYENSAWTELPEELRMIKQDGGLYVTTLEPAVSLYRNLVDGEDETLVRQADFLSWDWAVKEIDKLADKTASYTMKLNDNLGIESNGLAPLKNLTFPSKAGKFTITSNAEDGAYVFFTGAKLAPKCDTTFTNIGLMAVKQVKNKYSSWYESVSYDVNIGNYYVVMGGMLGENEFTFSNGDNSWTEYYLNSPGTVSGSKKGTFETWRRYYDEQSGGIDRSAWSPATKITGVGTVIFYDSQKSVETRENASSTFMGVPKGITGVDNLIINPYAIVLCGEGDISARNLTISNGLLRGRNLTVSGTTTLESATIVVGTETIGDGKCKLANVVLKDTENLISAKQDKAGKSLVEITGTVSMPANATEPSEAITIELWYNNYSSIVQMYDGMVLLYAAKAAAGWFSPSYTAETDVQATDENGNPMTDEENNPIMEVSDGMGWYRDGYGLYKNGKEIRYGKVAVN